MELFQRFELDLKVSPTACVLRPSTPASTFVEVAKTKPKSTLPLKPVCYTTVVLLLRFPK